MTSKMELTTDQQYRIETTLKRVRNGLDQFDRKQIGEPAHLFKPEALANGAS